jgi:hypothetical protein
VLQLFHHQHAAAAGYHEAVATGIVGAGRPFRRLVVAGGKRRHGVEEHRQGPVQFLAPAGENDVLFAELNDLGRVADAMRAGRAGRADRIVDAPDLEGNGQGRRVGARHGLGHGEGSDLLGAFFPRDVRGGDQAPGGRTTRTHDEARALVGNVSFREAGIRDRFLHGDVVVGRPVPHEAPPAPINRFIGIDLQRAMHVAPEPQVAVLLGKRDAGAPLAQRIQHLGLVVADARHDPHSGYDHAFHG